MKLQYLWVEEFKNLKEFEVDLSDSTEGISTVLLGQNGLGKSNLLEALVVIFRDLYLGRASNFWYKLRYTLNQGKSCVSIENRPRTAGHGSVFSFEVAEPGGETARYPLYAFKSTRRVPEPPGQRFLPRHVFAYYSGPSDRLEEHFRPHQRKFYEDLLDGRDNPFRPLFYARPIHSNFVLLAFYTKEDPTITTFLRDRLRIEGFETALFVLRKPPRWANRRPEGDPRFWRAIGTVQRFLAKVWDVAVSPMRLPGAIPDMFGKPHPTEFLYLLVPHLDALRELAGRSRTAVDFFKELESTYMSDVIHETRIRVRIRDYDNSLTFRELSEGEQQLLTVVGLLRFTKESESLFLLDEPDTHLNPAWGMEYLEILQETAGVGGDSQVIIATHDPLMLSGLLKEQVIVLDRDPSGSRINAGHPEIDPRGMGVSGILKSSMFGLSTTLDFPTQAKLDERFELAAKAERTEAEEQRLRDLSEELASAGFAQDFRDDNYYRFARAVAVLRKQKKRVLSRAEIADIEARALAAVKEIESEDSE